MVIPGRRLIWRAGRKLYMFARKDQPNDMATNGELRLQRLIVDNARSGAAVTAFDVGARIGDWSTAFAASAAALPGGFRLHAFEPVPDSRARLQEALGAQIAAGWVRINANAVSNAAATLPIYVPHFTGGTSTLHPDGRVQYEQVIEVETSTLDQYCEAQGIDHVDLIKIDTEGNDFRVLQGAANLLKFGRAGVVQFEYNHRWIHSRSYLKDVFDLVRDLPYRVAKVCSSALEVYVEWHPELERFFETNYALVHERLTGPLRCDFYRIGAGNVGERVVETPRTAAVPKPVRSV